MVQIGSEPGGKAGEAPPEQAEDGTNAEDHTGTGEKEAAGDPTVQAGDRPGGESGEEDTAEEPEDTSEPPSRDTGLSDRAKRAIETLENVKNDPVGTVNSEANHNHYWAARQEALGNVVARKDDGIPFSHIGDLQRASSALNNVCNAIEVEMRNPPSTLTARGQAVLQQRYSEVQATQSRLKGFLSKIGYGQFPPYHTWPPGS